MRCYLLIFLSLLMLTACSQVPPRDTSNQKVEENLLPERSKITAEERSPLYLSKDNGTSWEPFATEIPKDVNVSFFDTAYGEIVLATDNKGIFISENKRTSWKQISSTLPSPKINSLHVFDSTIYTGVFQYGIYVSENLGGAWHNINAQINDLSVQSICTLDGQLFIGTDSGLSRWSAEKREWEVLLEGLQVVSIERWQDKLVAGSTSGTLISDNQGQNWRIVHEMGALHYTHVVRGNLVEMLISGDLYISRDGGILWESSPYHPNHGTYVYEVIATPRSWLMSNNYGIFRSENSGLSWEHIVKIESMGFFDFICIGDEIIGGTRVWDEFRKKNSPE